MSKIKAKSQRQLQVGEEVKRIMAKIFFDEDIISAPGVRVTVTEADVSPDLKNIKFYIDIFASKEERGDVLSQLNKASGFFRKKLASKTTFRIAPEIRFKIDDVSDRVKNIESLIELESKKNKPENI